MIPVSIRNQFQQLRRDLEVLPKAEEPPPTTLQVLGRSHQEQDWQRLLFHFLKSEEAHGLDSALLEHLLAALSDRDDLSYTFSRFDLDTIRLDTEVILSNDRRPDAVVWSAEDWFVCWELKVDADEGEDQTCDYVCAESFQSIDLQKADVPPDGHHYVYLAPEDASPPSADAFAPVTWEWVAEELQSFLADSYGEYPARTTAQLDDFIDTIRQELTMTEYEENQQEKIELYLDYYEEIASVQQAFTDEWDVFTQRWGNKLARALDAATIIEDAAVPDEYVSTELTMEDGTKRTWVFRQGHDDWSWLFPQAWWTNFEEDRPQYIYDPSNSQARVGFLHRLEFNREVALRDHELIFYLRNAPASDDDFYNGFAKRFNADDEIPSLLPSATTRTGVKSNVLEATYTIPIEQHDDIFAAYIDALATALKEHIVTNPELIGKIDTVYQETIDKQTAY